MRGSTGIVIGGGGSSHGNDGPWNVLRNNEIRETGTGIAVSDHSHDQVVEDNLIVDSGSYGVMVREGSERAHVWRTRIDGWGTHGIFVWDSTDASILGNTLTGGPTPVVRIGGASTGYEVRDNDLPGHPVDHPGTGTVADNR